jgi:hypothetical protein
MKLYKGKSTKYSLSERADSDCSTLQLTDVLYSPDVSYTRMSIGCIDDREYDFHFHRDILKMVGPEGATIGVSPKTAQ